MIKLIIFLLCLGLVSLILFPAQASDGALEGIRLCGSALIPALLPFLVLTRLLSDRLQPPKNSVRILSLSATAYIPLLLSFIGGYPTGVATAVSLYQTGKLSRQEAERIIPYCNNSGPAFFVGVLGLKLFSDPQKGLWLYGIHVISAVCVFFLCYEDQPLLFRIKLIKEGRVRSFPQGFQEALADSCMTMIRICGLVILFSVLRRLLTEVLPNPWLPYMGVLELSSGLLNTGKEDFVLWAFFMGWGGLCVHMQAISLWQEAQLSVSGYFPKKILHGILSILFAWAVIWHKWYLIPMILLLCCVFFLFRKKWGRKKRKDRL